MILSLIFGVGLCIILSWLPGYGLARFLKGLDADEIAVAAWPLSWAILGGMQFLGFLLGLPAWWSYLVVAVCAALALSGLAGLRQAWSPEMRRVFLLGLAGIFGTLCLVMILPLYDDLAVWFGDWWMHLDVAHYYMGLRPADTIYFGVYRIPSRFPLFNLVEAAFLSILGDKFWVYQVTAVVPLASLVGATYLIARFWRGHGTPLLAAALLLVNPFVIQMTLTPWPKVMSAACVLLALAVYLRRGATGLPMWAFLSALGLLAHQGSISFIVAVAIDAVLVYRRAAIAPLIKAAVTGLIVVSSWLLWAAMTFGASTVAMSSPTMASRQALPGSLAWGIERLLNAFYTLLPFPLVYQVGLWIRSGFGRDGLLGIYGFVLRYTYHVLPGALTTVLSVVLIVGMWRRWTGFRPVAPRSHALTIPWVVAVTFVGGMLLQPGPLYTGLAAESLLPVVVLLMCAAANRLLDLSVRWRIAAIALVFCEFGVTRLMNTLLLAGGVVSISNDRNLPLKLDNGLQFLADLVTWEKWIAVLAGLLLWAALGVWLSGHVRKSGNDMVGLKGST